MSNTKKIALMSTLVLVLAVTAIFNFILAGTKTATVDGTTDAPVNYFTTYRDIRNTTRSEEFMELDAIIASSVEGSDEYTAAFQRKMELVQLMEDELVMESIIKGLGFSDAAVTITENDHINVFVNASELNDDDLTRIYYALEYEYQIGNGDVVIMPVYAESLEKTVVNSEKMCYNVLCKRRTVWQASNITRMGRRVGSRIIRIS